MNLTTLASAISAIVADGIALAVAFSVNITTVQQAAILTFVGATTTAIVGVVAYLEGNKLTNVTAVAVSTPPTAAQHAAAVAKVLA